MKHLNKNLQNRIERRLKELNKLRPLPPSAVKKLQEQFQIEMTYNSNAIEGNSLTLKETFLVINEGITIKGKPLKDHLEAKNHQEALEYLSNLVEKGKKQTISELFLRGLHQLVMQCAFQTTHQFQQLLALSYLRSWQSVLHENYRRK